MTHVDTPQAICSFGIAWQDITPPVGIYHRMWGAALHDQSEGVHRPLRLTAMVIGPVNQTSGQRQIVVALDHCLLGAREMSQLLEAVTSASGLARGEMFFIFSHTHAAGLMNLDRCDLPGGALIRPYLEDLAAIAVRTVTEALEHMRPATIVFGLGRCDLARQRDFWDETTEQFVCGFNPKGDSDDTLVVARISDERGVSLATIVNYACHPTTLAWQNRLISPDYPGAMREVVEAATGAPCLFIQGASGDLGPLEGYVGDVEIADRNGRQLGYAALAGITALPPPRTRFEYAGPVVSGATLGAWQHVALTAEECQTRARWDIRKWTLPIDYRPDMPTIEQARADQRSWQSREAESRAAGNDAAIRDCRAQVERNTRLLTRLAQLPPGSHYPFEISLWKSGDAWWVLVPGEHYQLLQREVRKHLNGPVIVATLANGWGPSYLPVAAAYGHGIYQESVAILAPGCLERVIAAICEEADAMQKL